MTKYIPIRSNFIVQITKLKKIGSFYVTDTGAAAESMAREEGIILAMGEDMFPDSLESNKPDIKIGDKVAFARYGGKQLSTDKDGNEIRVMRDIDILAKVIEEE